MLLMATSLIWSFLLLVSTNDIRKKHGLVNSETPRYWLIYLDLIYLQTIVHSAVQKKWHRKIGICHVFFSILLCPGQNYAWHDSFYATILLIMEATLSRVKDAAHREGNLCSRSRSIPLQNFGWPTRRVNYQGCWNSGFISQNLLNLSCQLIISRICWLVRLNVACTARVALNDLSILRSYVIFSDQVHWKIAIWDVELNACGKFWNTLLLVNSSMTTTIFWNYCCFLQFHLRRVNTFMDFSYFLSSILSKINANQ